MPKRHTVVTSCASFRLDMATTLCVKLLPKQGNVKAILHFCTFRIYSMQPAVLYPNCTNLIEQWNSWQTWIFYMAGVSIAIRDAETGGFGWCIELFSCLQDGFPWHRLFAMAPRLWPAIESRCISWNRSSWRLQSTFPRRDRFRQALIPPGPKTARR